MGTTLLSCGRCRGKPYGPILPQLLRAGEAHRIAAESFLLNRKLDALAPGLSPNLGQKQRAEVDWDTGHGRKRGHRTSEGRIQLTITISSHFFERLSCANRTLLILCKGRTTATAIAATPLVNRNRTISRIGEPPLPSTEADRAPRRHGELTRHHDESSPQPCGCEAPVSPNNPSKTRGLSASSPGIRIAQREAHGD